MGTIKDKRSLHEKAYVKAVCRAMREAVGISPTVTFRNRKRYHRPASKRFTKNREEEEV